MSKIKKYNQYSEYDNLMEGGEDAAKNEDAKEENKEEKKEEKEEKEEEKKEEEEEKKEEESDDDDPFAAPVKEHCCCCMCVCSNEFTQDASCCGCFPIKCGTICIGIFTVLVTVILFVWYFFLFLNEYLHWWYVLVCLILLCPLLVASNFIISWFTSDTRTTRALLLTSQILALVSVTLLCFWNLIYFVFIYKKDAFYAGMGDIPTNTYTKQSKKTWLFTMMFETVVLIVFFAYFLCVVTAYSSLMHGPEKDEEGEKKPDEESKNEEEKKDDKPEENAENEGAAAGEQ